MESILLTNEAYREIFQSMSEGILMVDETGMVSAANRQAEKLFGFEPDGLIGIPLEIYYRNAIAGVISISGKRSIQIHHPGVWAPEETSLP